ncbi:MAG TPA: hypothetical protein VKY44_03960 [Flavobacterium sp.]|nr:hypothetical protein [Flavobacterium sp.]
MNTNVAQKTEMQKIRVSDLEFGKNVFSGDNIKTSPYNCGFTEMNQHQLERFKCQYGNEIIVIDRNAKSPWAVFNIPAWSETIKAVESNKAKTLAEWGTNV